MRGKQEAKSFYHHPYIEIALSGHPRAGNSPRLDSFSQMGLQPMSHVPAWWCGGSKSHNAQDSRGDEEVSASQ